ncbi:Tat binding protein 1-interacting protein-domain-containing protein [Scleroderma yunnanense]
MATKAKNPDVKVLKGQEAEDAILQYMKKMNRPFGAVDISSNLKGAVPKATTAKILITLADKGEIVQKTYGKTNFYVINQAKVDTVPPDELAALEVECNALEEGNTTLIARVKQLTAELTRIKSIPTDQELNVQLTEADETVKRLLDGLAPLRVGKSLMSAEDMDRIDADWARWRDEWVRRRSVFNSSVRLAYTTPRCFFLDDAMPPQDALSLAEDLGIEFDGPEHVELERGPLCAVPNDRASLKRKRD